MAKRFEEILMIVDDSVTVWRELPKTTNVTELRNMDFPRRKRRAACFDLCLFSGGLYGR